MLRVGDGERDRWFDDDHFWFGRSGELVEHAPSRCPNDHPLGADDVLVGNIACMCQAQRGERQHRSWRCRRCDQQWVWPGCHVRRDLPVWDGITPRPRGRHR